MGKNYSNLLSNLKPLLPRGYQGKIVECIDGVTLDQVKNAFTNRYVNEETLKQIYKVAVRIAAKRTRDLKKAQLTLSKVKRLSRAASVFFFALSYLIF